MDSPMELLEPLTVWRNEIIFKHGSAAIIVFYLFSEAGNTNKRKTHGINDLSWLK